jgi:hypothetical protein
MKRLLAGALLIFAGLVQAAQPRTLHYQGYLADASGQPLSGTVQITFTLYDAASAGAALWSETHPAVQVLDGNFGVVLGALTELNLAFDAPYYLALRINADAEMAARLKLATSPYALRAGMADAAAPGAIGTADLLPATITPDKLGPTCGAGDILMATAAGWRCATWP